MFQVVLCSKHSFVVVDQFLAAVTLGVHCSELRASTQSWWR